jgi:cytochrome c-type biogenesis protein CcmH
MKARYGPFILFRPELSWGNAWLWFSPLVALVIGGFAAVRIIRRRGRMLAEQPAGDDADLDDESSRMDAPR